MATIHNDLVHAFSLRDSFFAETAAAPPLPPAESFDGHLSRAHDAATEPPPPAAPAPSPSAQNGSAAPAATTSPRRDDNQRSDRAEDEEPTAGPTDEQAAETKPVEANGTASAEETPVEKPAEEEKQDSEETKEEAVSEETQAAEAVALVAPPAVADKKGEIKTEAKAEESESKAPQATAAVKGDEPALEQPKQVVAVANEDKTTVVEATVPNAEKAKAETVEKTVPREAQEDEIVAAMAPKEATATGGAEQLAKPAMPVSPLAVHDKASNDGEASAGEEKSRGKRQVTAATAAAVAAEPAAATPDEATALSPAATAAMPVPVAAAAEVALPSTAPDDKPPPNAVGAIEGSRKPGTAASANAKDGAPAQPGGQAGVDPARFVQRVANAVRAANDANGTLRMKLSPPELGSLRLEITVRNGAMTARVEAETVETRNLLLDNLPALRERLAQQDIKIQHFQVDLADRRPGSGADQAAEQFHRRDQGHAPPGGSRATRATETTTAATTAVRRLNDNSQLNVIV